MLKSKSMELKFQLTKNFKNYSMLQSKKTLKGINLIIRLILNGKCTKHYLKTLMDSQENFSKINLNNKNLGLEISKSRFFDVSESILYTVRLRKLYYHKKMVLQILGLMKRIMSFKLMILFFFK